MKLVYYYCKAKTNLAVPDSLVQTKSSTLHLSLISVNVVSTGQAGKAFASTIISSCLFLKCCTALFYCISHFGVKLEKKAGKFVAIESPCFTASVAALNEYLAYGGENYLNMTAGFFFS